MIQIVSTHHNKLVPMTKGDKAMANAVARMVAKQNSSPKSKFEWDQDNLNIDIEEMSKPMVQSAVPLIPDPVVVPETVSVPLEAPIKATEVVQKVLAKKVPKISKAPVKAEKNVKAAKINKVKESITKKHSAWSWDDVIR